MNFFSKKPIIKLLRLKESIKNLLVFFPVFFSSSILQLDQLEFAAKVFTLFCFAAILVYILNDLLDKENDQLHPDKRNRPIAANTVSQNQAIAVMLACMACFLFLAKYFSLPFKNVLPIYIYILINIAYSMRLKHVPYLELLIIPFGFILRLLAGSATEGQQFTTWIFTNLYVLIIFILLHKRISEIKFTLPDNETRVVLKFYKLEELERLSYIAGLLVIVQYIMFVISDITFMRFGKINLFSILFVCFGIARFIYLNHKDVSLEDPVGILLHDRLSSLNVLLYIFLYTYLIYI